jgi:H+/Cl- antiporter ClcA
MAETDFKTEATPPTGEVEPAGTMPKLGHVLLVAFIVGVFAVIWLVAYEALNTLIWENDFVANNRWTIPVGVLFFSLLVGLVQKYLHAPNVIEGGVEHSLKAEDVSSYKTFWGTLLSSFFSLFSGASLGPEGPLGFLAVQIAQWLSAKLKFAKKGALLASLAGMSSAYNGVVGNPVFTALLASEVGGGQGGLALIAATLAAGAVGFLLFALLGVPAFAGFLDIGQPAGISLAWATWAIGLGLLGALLAAYTGIAFKVLGRIMGVFKDRVIERVLVAGLIIAVVGTFIPELLFSGESSIHTIIDNPAQYGVAMLLLMALLKPLLLALSLKSGYLGGPLFPALFTAVMVALAISLVAPGVPLAILVACLEVGVVTLLLKAPLTSILLVAVLAGVGTDATMLGLITVAAVTSLIAGRVVETLMGHGQPPE